VAVVGIPPELNVSAEYPIAVVKSAPHPALARRWIDLVKSPAGAAALREAGFVALSSALSAAPDPSRRTRRTRASLAFAGASLSGAGDWAFFRSAGAARLLMACCCFAHSTIRS